MKSLVIITYMALISIVGAYLLNQWKIPVPYIVTYATLFGFFFGQALEQ